MKALEEHTYENEIFLISDLLLIVNLFKFANKFYIMCMCCVLIRKNYKEIK